MKNPFGKWMAAHAGAATTSAAAPVDAGRYSRLGWLLLLGGAGGFLLWSSLAPLDQGVPLSGTVVVAGNRKAVQHQAGGTIQDILVREGERVQAGQVLVRMRDEQLASQADISQVQLLAAQATEARLIAERDGRRRLQFPPPLDAARGDPQVASLLTAQEQLFSARRLALQQELDAMDQTIAGLSMQIEGLSTSRRNKLRQRELLTEQLGNLQELAQDGYVPRNRALEVELAQVQITGAIAEDSGSLGRAQRQVSELRSRRVQRQQEYQAEVRLQLGDLQRDMAVLASRLRSQRFDLQNLEVKAPADGIIVGLSVFTRGGVVPPGFRMMDVVPSGDPLEIEGQLPVHLIDKVKPGLPVELHFSAFNQNRTPQIPGVVTGVSADRLTDDKTGMPYYKLHAGVAPEAAGMVAALAIQAGMPVEIFVRTGERTLMNYLFKPILDRAHTALTEE